MWWVGTIGEGSSFASGLGTYECLFVFVKKSRDSARGWIIVEVGHVTRHAFAVIEFGIELFTRKDHYVNVAKSAR